jgi:hypothetical protein
MLRSVVFTSLNHFKNDKYKTNGFGHTRFPLDNDDMVAAETSCLHTRKSRRYAALLSSLPRLIVNAKSFVNETSRQARSSLTNTHNIFKLVAGFTIGSMKKLKVKSNVCG